MIRSLIILIILLFSNNLVAGIVPCDKFFINGKSLDKRNVHINSEKDVTICCSYSSGYMSSDSGPGFVVYLLGNRVSLSDSVGVNGKNLPADVIQVAKALKKLGLYKGNTSTVFTSDLAKAIKYFQKNFAKLGNPDGQIDVKGHTHRHLNANLLQYIPSPIDLSQFQNCVTVKLEETNESLGFGYIPFAVFDKTHNRLLNHVVKFGHIIEWNAATISIKNNVTEQPELNFSTLIRINGEYPSKNLVESGVREKPVIFSWHSKPKNPLIEYRYRLFPYEKWSPWGKTENAVYSFIPRGAYVFQVQPRFPATNITRNIAGFQFVLEHPLTSQPLIAKAKISGSSPKPAIATKSIESFYPRSVALLIGIIEYDYFDSFDEKHITHDIKRMELSLKKKGFLPQTHIKRRIKKGDLDNIVSEFSRNLREDDRVIVYISSHGTEHPGRKSKGYIASSDCNPAKPRSSCFEINDLVEILEEKLSDEGPRHLAVILDSCSSGLGVIGKESNKFNEISVAQHHGAHILTAGTENQTAFIDKELGGSIFTYFLTLGLDGNADYTQDGIVTLQELSVYSRYHVAKFLQKCRNNDQTPTLGRFWGSGEMVFKSGLPTKSASRYENECP